jgi:hypothetical protein
LASSRRLALCAALLTLALCAQAEASGGPSQASISTPPPLQIHVWTPNTDDLSAVTGEVSYGNAPVAGVLLRVGDFELPQATDAQGRFSYLADQTLLARYPVSVADASHATVHGVALSAAAQQSLTAQHAAISFAYPISDLHATLDTKGDPTLSGRITFAGGRDVPPTVALYSYKLTGTVTDSSGKPVPGAVVSTRTGDRNYWTISTTTDASGHYTSLFTASDEAGDNPVPMNVEVAIGNVVYSLLSFEFVEFPALRSAELNVRLPPSGFAMVPPVPTSYPGAIYQGTVVGVSSGNQGSVLPLSVTWPDSDGRFSITLPHALAGRTVSLWEAELQLFSSTKASPGGAIDVASWPRSLPGDAVADVTTVKLP